MLQITEYTLAGIEIAGPAKIPLQEKPEVISTDRPSTQTCQMAFSFQSLLS